MIKTICEENNRLWNAWKNTLTVVSPSSFLRLIVLPLMVSRSSTYIHIGELVIIQQYNAINITASPHCPYLTTTRLTNISVILVLVLVVVLVLVFVLVLVLVLELEYHILTSKTGWNMYSGRRGAVYYGRFGVWGL